MFQKIETTTKSDGNLGRCLRQAQIGWRLKLVNWISVSSSGYIDLHRPSRYDQMIQNNAQIIFENSTSNLFSFHLY